LGVLERLIDVRIWKHSHGGRSFAGKEKEQKELGERFVITLGHDSRLKWLSPTSVRIDISKLIPATNAQTTSARRRRFKKALEECLSISGWHKVSGKVEHIFLVAHAQTSVLCQPSIA
jgi:hypothetical protein